MLPPVEQALLELKARQTFLDMDGHVFLNKAGKPIEKGLDQVWAKALKKAGPRHRPSYQLRHTFASLCIQEGIAPGWVAQTLGHSSLEMTFSRYARYIPEAMSEQHRKLAHLFGTQEETKPVSAQPDLPASEEITKEITAAIIPISSAAQKPNRVRRPRGLKQENQPTVGFEPTTCGLRNRCSTTELRRHFTSGEVVTIIRYWSGGSRSAATIGPPDLGIPRQSSGSIGSNWLTGSRKDQNLPQSGTGSPAGRTPPTMTRPEPLERP